MSVQNCIELKKINKVFKARRQEIYALKDIDLYLRKGEVVSITGPSGCGKSTIIRIIDDIIKPTSGQVLINGENISAYKRIPEDINRKMGFIFQQSNLFPWLKIRDNVRFPLRIYRMQNDDMYRYADELLSMVGLDSYADSYPGEISGGSAQMIGVIRALAHKPEILLMDEPFGALDAMTREKLDLDILDIWQKMHQTIVFITHNVEEAVLVSGRIYVMGTNPGHIVKDIDINLPYPRTLEMIGTKKFKEYCDMLIGLIGTVDLSTVV